MDDLSRQYQQRIDQYNRLVADSIANPANFERNAAAIRRLNVEIAGILDKMLGQLAMARQSTTSLAAERERLLQNLQRIQRDANALARDSDQLETLRRIRAFEETESTWSQSIYLILFLVVSGIVLIVLMFKRPQPDMTSVIPSSAVATPAFT